MALFDDRKFLLSHINHSFITGDDNGICEMVMLDDDVIENQHQICLKLLGQDADERPESCLDPEAYDLSYESELFESERGQSYDIDTLASDLEYICHRRRSNTAQRLDRLKKDKINQSKTRTIVWRSNSPNDSHNDGDRLSHDSPTNEKTSSNSTLNDEGVTANGNSELATKARSPPKKSALTRLLERFPSLPKNPFSEYAQYEGTSSDIMGVKKILIYVAINQHHSPLNDMANHISSNSSGIGSEEDQAPAVSNNINNNNNSNKNNAQQIMANGATSATATATATATAATATVSTSTNTNTTGNKKPKNNEPIEVVIVNAAKVRDLIGLICWQYTNEGREPKLQPDINRYCLRIAEDNGEVDLDFGRLNESEFLGKFDFPCLAITEKIEEPTRTFNQHPCPPVPVVADGSPYNHRPPQVTSVSKPANTGGRFAPVLKIFFKDAKLDFHQ